jgi:N-glycosylase/DNA lyase
MAKPSLMSSILLPAENYDLAATLDSGQVFRWQFRDGAWHGILGHHALRLAQTPEGIHATAHAPITDWTFLRHFLQSDVHLDTILKTFPVDDPMTAAIAHCHGLRLLRQDPWECLASFILSSTKQIVQIRQIVALLCERFGDPIATGDVRSSVSHAERGDSGHPLHASRVTHHAFPPPARLAAATEAELRTCKMGFRAKGLLHAARDIAEGRLDLEYIRTLDYAAARAELTKLHGVGIKIADCVLLFAYGFDSAFPVDVWIERALQHLYFPRRRASHKRLHRFAATHFGPHAGYAQQYLFHYIRTRSTS